MVIKTNLRKVISYVVTLAMIVSVMAGLDFGVITAEATSYSGQTWNIKTGDDGTIQSVNFQFKTSDTAPGTWYLYLWDKNDTSGTNGRPQILSSASETTSDGSHSLTINYNGEHGKEYLIGMVLKGSRWSTENTSGSEYSDWPYLTSVCDMVDCDDEELAGDVYINGKKSSGSVSDSLKTEGITINFASAGGTTGTMDSVTLPAGTEIYTLPAPGFTPDANREFYLWDVVDEKGDRFYPQNQNIELSGDSKTYTATAYYGYTATITSNIDDYNITFISETMIQGKKLLSPEFSSSPNPNLEEGNGIIINTTLSPAPKITATNATIDLAETYESDGKYTYFYLATNITGPVTATAEAGESEDDFTSDTVLMEGFTTSVDEETGVITISNIFAKNGGKLYYDVMPVPDLPESEVDLLNAEISKEIGPDNVFVDKLKEIDGNSVTITMTENAPYVVILCEVHDINVIEDSNGLSKFASRVINLYFANGNEEEVTYNVTLDSSNYEGNVILITYDNGNKYREETNINGNVLEVPESGFARVFGYGGAFTVTAEGATVGELIDAGEEGSYREITNFTNDTTIVVNAVVPHVCKFGEWEITTPATVTADGLKTRKCDCGETETAVVKFVPVADKDTGVLTEDTKPENNECNADVDIENNDIITDIGLEDDEIKAIENGENISIYLDVKNADTTVSATDKTATESTLTDDMKIGMFLDINLFKKIGDNAAENITSTLKPVRITFKVPDELIKNGRIFSIVRVHNGTTDILSCDFDAATKTASFETDKFSSYAITYKDSTDDSGNTTPESSTTTTPESSVTTTPESSVTTSPDESSGTNRPVIPNIPVVTGAPTTTPATTTTATTSTTTAPAAEEDVEEDVEEDIEIDDDTDTTKPADDEDEADDDVDSDDDAEDSDVDGDVNETDGNPVTGVTISFTGILIAGAAVLLLKKRK